MSVIEGIQLHKDGSREVSRFKGFLGKLGLGGSQDALQKMFKRGGSCFGGEKRKTNPPAQALDGSMGSNGEERGF